MFLSWLRKSYTFHNLHNMKFATLLAFSASAYGIAFDGPLPTPVTDLVYAALNGFTPKPTPLLPELLRRQKPSSNPAVCGFLNGDGGMYVRRPRVKLRREHAFLPNTAPYILFDCDQHMPSPQFNRARVHPEADYAAVPYPVPEDKQTNPYIGFPLSCSAASTCLSSASANWFGCCASSSCAAITRCVNSASLSSCLGDKSCFDDPGAMACSASDAPFCVNMFAGSLSHWVCGATETSVPVTATASTTGDASRIVQGAKSTVGGLRATASLAGDAPASASAASTGAAAVRTAGAMVGVAVGAVVMFL